MYQEIVKEQQPLVYQALKSSLETDRVNQAYLFSGPRGTCTYEAGMLLAMSLLCEHSHPFACEQCNTCRRVKENLYADFVILDGREKAISKEQVDALQSQFAQTALEKSGKRIYLIRKAENATLAAANSMLKFLEEPGKDTTAILLCENTEAVLPTIRSRCLILPFAPVKKEYYLEQAEKAGLKDGWLLSACAPDPLDLSAFAASKPYQNGILMLQQFLNINGRREELLIDYNISYRDMDKDTAQNKKANIALINIFLDLLAQYAKDAVTGTANGPDWYQAALQKKMNYAKLLRTALEQKNRCNASVDLNLLMDQTMYRLEDL